MTTHTEPVFTERLHALKDLYIEVKEAILLAENFDKDNAVYLSPLNELRNALDHIMRAVADIEAAENELHEAREHLYRAGYDAYEVFSINVGNSIVKCIERYRSEVIVQVFPAYYTDIKKDLIMIKVELASVRASKRVTPVKDLSSFTPYKEKVSSLLQHLKSCEQTISDLERERLLRLRKWWVDFLVYTLINICVGALGLMLYDYLKTK